MSTSIDFIDLARRHGLDLERESLVVEDVGLDFAVGFASDRHGQAWVLRVPRRPDAWPKAQYEARILELVGSVLPVAVPRWVVCDESLIAYRRLPGVPMMTVGRTADGALDPVWRIEPESFAQSLVDSLGAFVAALHALKPAELPCPTTSEIRAKLSSRIDAARALVPIHEGRLVTWRRWLDDDEMWLDPPVMTHGELHPLHLLIAEDGAHQLVGVLDWTEAEITDPVVDYAVLHKSFGSEKLDRIVTQVEGITGRPRSRRLGERVALWESLFSINLLEFASRSNSAPYFGQARQMLASE